MWLSGLDYVNVKPKYPNSSAKTQAKARTARWPLLWLGCWMAFLTLAFPGFGFGGGPLAGNPFAIGSGAKWQYDQDYLADDPFPLSSTRSYNSEAPNNRLDSQRKSPSHDWVPQTIDVSRWLESIRYPVTIEMSILQQCLPKMARAPASTTYPLQITAGPVLVWDISAVGFRMVRKS